MPAVGGEGGHAEGDQQQQVHTEVDVDVLAHAARPRPVRWLDFWPHFIVTIAVLVIVVLYAFVLQ